MSMLIPPQMINTMEEHDLRHDRVRNYMAPALSDRQTEWTSHPMSSRDSLHEADMWAVEGLTHRYPTKVLAELIPTCPAILRPLHADGPGRQRHAAGAEVQVRGQAERPLGPDARLPAKTPQVRDVVVSGGDMANVPIKRLEDFVLEAARHREHPRHPDRVEGPDGAPPALPPGRRPGRAASAMAARPAHAAWTSRAHPRELRAAGDAARGQGRAGVRSRPGSATCATRGCCCGA